MIGPGPAVAANPRAGKPNAVAVVAAMRRSCRRFMVAPELARRSTRSPAVPDSSRALTGSSLADAERLEGDDGVGILDAGKHLHLLVDEVPDVGVVIDVEFNQQVVIAGGGIDPRRNLGRGKRIGHRVGLAKLALDLDKEGNHRCRLRKALGAI